MTTTRRTMSQAARENLRQKALGRRLSEETKAKIIETKRRKGTLHSGPNHYKWKGGKPWERFKNPDYIAWRNAVLERDNYTCQDCQRVCNKYEKGLAAHHIKEYALYPELRLDVANGQTLCRACHMRLHGKEFTIEQITCACGCGTIIDSKDRYGRPRSYINHHSSRGKVVTAHTKQLLREKRIGKKLTEEHKQKIAKGLQTTTKRIGRPPKTKMET